MILPPRQGGGGTRAPALACVVGACVKDCAHGHVCCSWSCGVVVSDFRTPPRTTVVRSRSTSGRHVFVKSSNSFIFSLYERSLARLVINLVLLVSYVSLVSHTSHSYRTSHLHRMSHSWHTSLSVRFRESASTRAPALACIVARGMLGCGSLLCTTVRPPSTPPRTIPL